ncbi:hypothetical protein CK203_114156 [Vitis vinifera]|uniref:Integrase catalytic domain-containing protein n=1 Tax=Vitis vinifera TaxID=29760 RepID=A0A438F8M5_VITVI|nr:hypothetical protein CK203_114156 [Vitis vinifera]
MSKACSHSTYVISNIEINIKPMALRTMGHGHSRTSPSCACPKRNFCSLPQIISVRWEEAEAYASIKDRMSPSSYGKILSVVLEFPSIIADNGPHLIALHSELLFGANIQNSYSTPQYPQIIPTEIGLPTIRIDAAKQSDANMELGRNLDWTDEVRESGGHPDGRLSTKGHQHITSQSEAKKLKNGTLVLRKVFENTAEVGAEKFQANWEGPYIVSKASESGAYYLQKLDGTSIT